MSSTTATGSTAALFSLTTTRLRCGSTSHDIAPLLMTNCPYSTRGVRYVRRVCSGARCAICEATANERVCPPRIDHILPTNDTCLGAATAATRSGRASVPPAIRASAGACGTVRAEGVAAPACGAPACGAAPAAGAPSARSASAATARLADRTAGVVEGRGVGGIDVRGGGRGGVRPVLRLGGVDGGRGARSERVLLRLRVVLVEVEAGVDAGGDGLLMAAERHHDGRDRERGGDGNRDPRAPARAQALHPGRRLVPHRVPHARLDQRRKLELLGARGTAQQLAERRFLVVEGIAGAARREVREDAGVRLRGQRAVQVVDEGFAVVMCRHCRSCCARVTSRRSSALARWSRDRTVPIEHPMMSA